MYSKFQLAVKYLKYYLTASNGKGHGIHSPFVFDFIKFVLNDAKKYDCYRPIEKLRNNLLQQSALIKVEDFGAGSGVIKTNDRIVKKIAASSLKPKKYAQLLYRMAKYYKPNKIVELGTSFGITTSYLASANNNTAVHSFEGAAAIAAIAQQQFDTLGLQNVHLHKGNFEDTLPAFLKNEKAVDFIFIDGNHRKQPTIEYFNSFIENVNPVILIFDDIHWSAEMEEAWEYIKNHKKINLSIDLFFIGIVCIKKELLVKQHFSIRY
ncbi:MAG: class I SAM-dependent methyltransferase [Bacteroidetes bacterium]|nr:class I SAM-dependent methyltransferase [Bacteroidota bacterium]